MTEPRITLSQLKLLNIHAVNRAKQLPPPGRVVRIETLDGKTYHVTGVRLSRGGSQVIIGDGQESVLLPYRSRTATQLRLLVVGLALIGSVSTLVGVLSSKPTPDISKRVEQLTAIRKSLADLDAYVSEQRSTLQNLSNDIDRLQKEKISLSRVAQIDREQVQALVEYQAAYQHQREWLSLGLSFIIGILSSLSATLLLPFFRRRTPAVEPADTGASQDQLT
jgi:hypothetical protein